VVLIPSAGVMILFDHLVWTCFFNEAVLLGLAGVGIQPDPRHRYPMWSRLLIPINNRILVGGLEHLYFPAILGMSSSQLTNSIIFQRGRLNHQPELVSRCALLTCRLVADVLVFPRMFDGEKHMPYTHTLPQKVI